VCSSDLCAKGSAGIMQHYSPARLNKPLLRTGERGEGKFKEIDRPHKLVFTWISEGTGQKETLVTLTFVHNDEGTLLTLVHEDFAEAEMVEMHTGGWTAILDKLAGMVTT